MKEIIGENLQTFFDNANVQATKTYSGNIGYWSHFEVWEMSEADYKKICDMTDEEWDKIAAHESWWRGAEGSNMGAVNELFKINGVSIAAWRRRCRVDDYEKDWNEMSEEEKSEYESFEDFLDTWCETEYKDLLEYFCEEIGASTERNVCALATDLASQNHITMAELFRKCGGSREGN